MYIKNHSFVISRNDKTGLLSVTAFYYHHYLSTTTRNRNILACWYRLECDCRIRDNQRYQPLADVDLNITVNEAMEYAYQYLLEENGYKVRRKGGKK